MEEEKTSPQNNENVNIDDQNNSPSFQCMICLDQAKNAVVTQCGHMYCWECLEQWLNQQHTCPICKSEVTKENVIPIYNSADSTDPRNSSRPSGHYTEPPPQQPRNQFPFAPFLAGNVSMFSMGFGSGGFVMNMNTNTRNRPQRQLTEEERQQRKIQQYVILAFVFLPLIIRIVALFLV
ncbi:RING-type E3 ubiquitin transferase [Entamoeba marina]